MKNIWWLIKVHFINITSIMEYDWFLYM